MSFKKRLLICFAVVAIVPMLVTSSWLIIQNIRTTTDQYETASKQILETKRVSLDLMLESVRTNILEVLSTPELITLLNGVRSDYTIQNVESEYEQVRAKLLSMQVLENDIIRNIGIYSPDVDRTIVCSYFSDNTVREFYTETEEAQGKLLWKVRNTDGGIPEIYIVGAALIPGNGKVVGMVFLELQYSKLMELVQPTQNRHMERNFLFGDDQLIAANQMESEDLQMLESFRNMDEQQAQPVIQKFSYDGKIYFAGSVLTTLNGWKYITITPEEYLSSEMYQNISPVVYMMIVTLIVSAFLSLILSKSAYKPVSHLAKLLDGIDRDQLDIHLDQQKDDELNQLASSLTQMMGRIQSLIAQVEAEKEAKFSAEMAALKSQINPHFLYNTLNMIKCLAADGNREDAEQVCVCLIRLLRTSIGNSHECISLEEELSYVKNYTEILHFRVDKQFDLVDNVAEEFKNVLIPKFTLQPIVENCIIHGFEEGTNYNSIVITAKKSQGDLEVSVTDNGKGICEEKIRELKDALHNREGLKFSHVGLLNVHERFRHIYGEQYGLTIQSFENDGTRVSVQLPIRYDK